MSAPRQRSSSVFAKLAAIMLVMAFLLMFVTTVFFVVLVQPSLHGRMNPVTAHVWLLFLSLLVMASVIFTTQRVLEHLLRPLRVLNDGVIRLGEGDLGVRLPAATNDEFGRLTEAFNRMAASVREMISTRDRLLIDVSHELRSPLTRMKVALELMPGDRQRARLSTDVAEMERMISGLLELERLRTGRGVTLVRQDIVPLVREATIAYEDLPPGIQFAANGAASIMLDVDAEQLRTVMRNLLENAVKYSLPDSRAIRVSVENDPAAAVRVTDDGIGIPAEDSERIFEPFFRVDRSRSKESGGYGLGLSICKRVMEAHGGRISVDRPNGRGVSFVLTFPQPTSVPPAD